MIKFIFAALVVSTSLFAYEIPITETPAIVSQETLEKKPFNPRKGHFITSLGFEGMKYETPYNYQGVQDRFSPGDIELWGGRAGIGAEIFLGGSFVATSKVEAYYMGTLFARSLNAGPQDESEEAAFRKTTGNLFGVDVSQSLGFIFEAKTKNPFMDEWAYLIVEPFIEAGIGKAYAYGRVNYKYDTGPTGTEEGYKHKFSDDLMNVRVGAGVNLTSTNGYFLYIKATLNQFDVLQRKSEVYNQQNHQTNVNTVSSTDKSVKLDPVTIFALGGGYKF